MSNKEHVKTLPQPCLQLAIEMGQVAKTSRCFASTQLQLERQLGQLQDKYQQQCEQASTDGTHFKPHGLNLEFVRGTALLNIVNEIGNEVRVIFGGNRSILVTINAAGQIHASPPQGPGDPEVRQAVMSIIQSVNLLNNKLGAAAQGAAA